LRFLVDESVPVLSVGRLRDAGHDVTSVRETSRGASDHAVLRHAAEEGRILVTFDRDFGALVFQGTGPLPAGVLFLRFEPESPEHAAQVILDLLVVPGLELMDRFTVVDGERVRQRLLRRD